MMVRLQRMWIQLRADRRRFGALCVMLGIGLLLWARIIVISNMPRTAVAEDDSPQASAVSQERSKAATEQQDAQPIILALVAEPARDPFVISTEHFPKLVQEDAESREEGKFGKKGSEDPEQQEARYRATLQSFVDQMELNGVLIGNEPVMARIDGRLYRLNDLMPASTMDVDEVRFRLIAVRQRSVVLEFEGREFELKMMAPGNR